MLVLSRKVGESVIIDGRIMVKIVRVDGEAVRIGIEAPSEVPIHRQEIYEEIQRTNQEARTSGRVPLPRLAKPAAPSAAAPTPPKPA